MLLIVAGISIFGVSVWAMRQLDSYQSLSPAQRAEVDREAQTRAEAVRRDRLKGTDCEKLDAVSCYQMRRQRKNLEAAARAWQDSDMQKAYEEAGVRQ
ncbi:MAG: hypothetical protein ACJ8FS_15400 [Sphingomicrobium sp.]